MCEDTNAADLSRRAGWPSQTMARWLSIGFCAVVWFYFCWPLLTGNSFFGYRDTATLYYPLYTWIERHVDQDGELPLWNPHDDFGYSMAVDGSCALFYPGKFIFRLLGLRPLHELGIYWAMHLAIAMYGCWVLARRLSAGYAGAAVAAISYAFGMPVLFQVTNVIFLVGAAWLPWALGFAHEGMRGRGWTGCIFSGIAIALMVLGGDVETAYVSLLVIGAATLTGWRLMARGVGVRKPLPGILGRLALLITMVILCAAVQWVPSWRASRESHRHFYVAPRSIYQSVVEWMQFGKFGTQDSDASHETRPPPSGSHDEQIYQYSVWPWVLAGWFSPRLYGEQPPAYDRWTHLASEDQMWVPSVYQGTMTVALVCLVLFHRRRTVWENGLIAASVLFVIASFGWYGGVWLLKEMQVVPQSSGLFEPVGGLYWLMIKLLPGFDSFRYPAKLIVFSSLCTALLAGLGVRRLQGLGSRSKVLERLVLFLFFLVALAVGLSLIRSRSDERTAVAWLVGMGGLFALLNLGGLVAMLGRVPAGPMRSMIAVFMLGVDLCVWNSGLLPWDPKIMFDAMVAAKYTRKLNLLSDTDCLDSYMSIESLASLVVKEHLRGDEKARDGNAARDEVAKVRSWIADLKTTPWPDGQHYRFDGVLLNDLRPLEISPPETRRLMPQLAYLREAVDRIYVEDHARVWIPGNFRLCDAKGTRRPNRIEFSINSDSEGWFLLPVRHDPSWQCTQQENGERVNLARAASFFCCIQVQPGRHAYCLTQTPLIARAEFWISLFGFAVGLAAIGLRVHSSVLASPRVA